MKIKQFKKITAVLLSALIMLSALSITVSAENIFEDSEEIEGGKTYSFQVGSEKLRYKIQVNGKGTMKINISSYIKSGLVYVYDSDGADVEPSSSDKKTGKWYWGEKFERSYDTGAFKGYITYKVKPGVYYITFDLYNNKGEEDFKFSVSLPDSGDSSQTKVSSTTIMLNMSAGDKIDLSAVKSGKVKSDATWTSSDKKIAKVSSKGVITAVKSGQCTITWKSGSTSFSILVNVE